MFKPTRRRAAVVFTLESRNCSKFLTHRVVNSSDEIGVPHDGLGGPPNLDVSDGVVAPPRDELVDVEDESDDDLNEHCQVQVTVDALLLCPERPVGWNERTRLRIR